MFEIYSNYGIEYELVTLEGIAQGHRERMEVFGERMAWLIAKNRTRVSFKEDWGEGTVTKGKIGTFGTFVGPKFSITLETDAGTLNGEYVFASRTNPGYN